MTKFLLLTHFFKKDENNLLQTTFVNVIMVSLFVIASPPMNDENPFSTLRIILIIFIPIFVLVLVLVFISLYNKNGLYDFNIVKIKSRKNNLNIYSYNIIPIISITLVIPLIILYFPFSSFNSFIIAILYYFYQISLIILLIPLFHKFLLNKLHFYTLKEVQILKNEKNKKINDIQLIKGLGNNIKPIIFGIVIIFAILIYNVEIIDITIILISNYVDNNYHSRFFINTSSNLFIRNRLVQDIVVIMVYFFFSFMNIIIGKTIGKSPSLVSYLNQYSIKNTPNTIRKETFFEKLGFYHNNTFLIIELLIIMGNNILVNLILNLRNQNGTNIILLLSLNTIIFFALLVGLMASNFLELPSVKKNSIEKVFSKDLINFFISNNILFLLGIYLWIMPLLKLLNLSIFIYTVLIIVVLNTSILLKLVDFNFSGSYHHLLTLFPIINFMFFINSIINNNQIIYFIQIISSVIISSTILLYIKANAGTEINQNINLEIKNNTDVHTFFPKFTKSKEELLDIYYKFLQSNTSFMFLTHELNFSYYFSVDINLKIYIDKLNFSQNQIDNLYNNIRANKLSKYLIHNAYDIEDISVLFNILILIIKEAKIDILFLYNYSKIKEERIIQLVTDLLNERIDLNLQSYIC